MKILKVYGMIEQIWQRKRYGKRDFLAFSKGKTYQSPPLRHFCWSKNGETSRAKAGKRTWRGGSAAPKAAIGKNSEDLPPS